MRRTSRLNRNGQAVQSLVGLKSVNPILYNAIGGMCLISIELRFCKMVGLQVDQHYKVPDSYDEHTYMSIHRLDNSYWFDEERQPKRFQDFCKLLKKHHIAEVIHPANFKDYTNRILLRPYQEFVDKVAAMVETQGVNGIRPQIDRLDGAFALKHLSFDAQMFFMKNASQYTIFSEDAGHRALSP